MRWRDKPFDMRFDDMVFGLEILVGAAIFICWITT